jgi:hypothetical protein
LEQTTGRTDVGYDVPDEGIYGIEQEVTSFSLTDTNIMSINGIECKPIQTITCNYLKSKCYRAESARIGKKF